MLLKHSNWQFDFLYLESERKGTPILNAYYQQNESERWNLAQSEIYRQTKLEFSPFFHCSYKLLCADLFGSEVNRFLFFFFIGVTTWYNVCSHFLFSSAIDLSLPHLVSKWFATISEIVLIQNICNDFEIGILHFRSILFPTINIFPSFRQFEGRYFMPIDSNEKRKKKPLRHGQLFLTLSLICTICISNWHRVRCARQTFNKYNERKRNIHVLETCILRV